MSRFYYGRAGKCPLQYFLLHGVQIGQVRLRMRGFRRWDYRSLLGQAASRPVSTWMGDRLGTPGLRLAGFEPTTAREQAIEMEQLYIEIAFTY